jgi:hypothetical protein
VLSQNRSFPQHSVPVQPAVVNIVEDASITIQRSQMLISYYGYSDNIELLQCERDGDSVVSALSSAVCFLIVCPSNSTIL